MINFRKLKVASDYPNAYLITISSPQTYHVTAATPIRKIWVVDQYRWNEVINEVSEGITTTRTTEWQDVEIEDD